MLLSFTLYLSSLTEFGYCFFYQIIAIFSDQRNGVCFCLLLLQVLISSFKSHVLKLKVAKKAGKQHADLLAEDDDSAGGGGGGSGVAGGLWNSIASTFSSSSSGAEKGGVAGAGDEETLNIFSLASGHLYERFIRIMMLSVLKQTRAPVKFWFLKNYLSPSLKDFLPTMARHYGFQYELVQYKWPRWLHQQTEKQRIIWGYKILFLDVLFPLKYLPLQHFVSFT